MNARAWAVLVLLGGIWGASYMFIEIGLRDLSPAGVAFVRVALAALVLFPIAKARGELSGIRPHVPMIAAIALVQVAAPFLLISAGQEEIASSLAGILVSSTPLFTAILAIWIDHEERSRGVRLGGLIVGFAGIVLLFGVDLDGSSKALLGGLAVVLASVGYALGSFMVKHRMAHVRPIGLVAGVMTASALLLLPVAAATTPDSVPGAGPLAAVAALGLVGTGAAFVLFYRLIAEVGAARTLVVTYVAPGFAVVYGALLLDEQITAATIGGLVLIVFGSVLAANGRATLRPAPAPVSEESPPPPAVPVAPR